jgi:hypothetical protein
MEFDPTGCVGAFVRINREKGVRIQVGSRFIQIPLGDYSRTDLQVVSGIYFPIEILSYWMC